ncbi:MAG TPA: hypothetical protein VIU63_09965 [Nitrospira sp.]
MKFLLYAGLVLGLVPLHTTLLPHVSIWGIRPDLGLVAAAMIGLIAGELEGLAVGLAIGWVLNMYSAGDVWLSLLTKGGAGLLAGLLGRQVAQVTPILLCVGLLLLSLAAGIVAVFTMKSLEISDSWWMVQSIVLPQACFDAALGAALVWMSDQRFVIDRLRVFDKF